MQADACDGFWCVVALQVQAVWETRPQSGEILVQSELNVVLT
jgi:hypothetical protein